MNHIIRRHKTVWENKIFLTSAIYGLFLLILSLIINYATGTYASAKASNSVSDIFLDNLPTFDVNIIFIDGFILFLVFILALILYQPKKIPFVLKSMALFIFIRAIFMTLTHIAPSPEQIPLEGSDISLQFTFGADLFFSGHVGLSYLMALIFWDDLRLRIIFIISSIIFGISVLLGHLHYSIDVFAAYFITYTIFEMAKNIFAKDYNSLQSNEDL
jgi:hypothetical protein